MDNENQNQSISEKVAAAVKSGRLKMRPKWHFILRAALWTTGIIIAALAAVYLSSLFIFITWRSGIWVAPLFGIKGIFIFLASIPWLLLLLTAVFAVVLEILMRHYSFAWRQPLIYLTAAILLAAAFGGFILAVTPFHSALSHCSPLLTGSRPSAGTPPCGGGVYRDLNSRRFNNIHKGLVIKLANPNFVIENRQQDRLLILVTPRTRLPFGSDFSVGDLVVVVGERRGDQVEAFGVSEVND